MKVKKEVYYGINFTKTPILNFFNYNFASETNCFITRTKNSYVLLHVSMYPNLNKNHYNKKDNPTEFLQYTI